MSRVIFLVGGPGSGKDAILKTIFEEPCVELNFDHAVLVEDYQDDVNIVVNGSACDSNRISEIKEHMESLGYHCSMVLVNTTNGASRDRNNKRQKPMTEERREAQWLEAQKNYSVYRLMFRENLHLIDNSIDFFSASEEQKQNLTENLQTLKSKLSGDINVLFEHNFEGTDELVDNYINATPGQVKPKKPFQTFKKKVEEVWVKDKTVKGGVRQEPDAKLPAPKEAPKPFIKGTKRVKGKDGFWYVVKESDISLDESNKQYAAVLSKYGWKEDKTHSKRSYGKTYNHPNHGQVYVDPDGFAHHHGHNPYGHTVHMTTKDLETHLKTISEETSLDEARKICRDKGTRYKTEDDAINRVFTLNYEQQGKAKWSHYKCENGDHWHLESKKARGADKNKVWHHVDQAWRKMEALSGGDVDHSNLDTPKNFYTKLSKYHKAYVPSTAKQEEHHKLLGYHLKKVKDMMNESWVHHQAGRKKSMIGRVVKADDGSWTGMHSASGEHIKGHKSEADAHKAVQDYHTKWKTDPNRKTRKFLESIQTMSEGIKLADRTYIFHKPIDDNVRGVLGKIVGREGNKTKFKLLPTTKNEKKNIAHLEDPYEDGHIYHAYNREFELHDKSNEKHQALRKVALTENTNED